MDDEQTAKRLGKPECRAQMGKLSKGCVDVLMNISEEISVKEQEPNEIFDQTGWDETIRSWRECSPMSGLFAPLQKSKKVKPENPSPHCILCTDLKDPKFPQHLIPGHATSHAFSEKSEEPSTSTGSSSLEDHNRTPSATTTSSSTEEEEPSDFGLKNASSEKDELGNKPLIGPEKDTPDKILAPRMQSDSLLQKAGKTALPGRVMVLPPVKMSTTPPNSNPLRRTEEGSARSLILREKCNGNLEKMLLISYPNSAVGTSQAFLTSKQGPTHHLLSPLSIPKGYQIPITTAAETQTGSTSVLERSFREEDLIRSPLRNKSGHKSRFGLQDKTLKRAEPELPKLLGTRVQIAVSNHRLL